MEGAYGFARKWELPHGFFGNAQTFPLQATSPGNDHCLTTSNLGLLKARHAKIMTPSNSNSNITNSNSNSNSSKNNNNNLLSAPVLEHTNVQPT